MLDRTQGRRPGTATVSADQDHIGMGFGHPGCNRADAHFCYEFYGDAGLRVDVLQIVDQLRQILDRVDIVMWRRRDQPDSRSRVP